MNLDAGTTTGATAKGTSKTTTPSVVTILGISLDTSDSQTWVVLWAILTVVFLFIAQQFPALGVGLAFVVLLAIAFSQL